MEEFKKELEKLSAEYEALRQQDDSAEIERLVAAYKQELSERYAAERETKMAETAEDIRVLSKIIARRSRQAAETPAEVPDIQEEPAELTEPEAIEVIEPETVQPTTTE